MHRSLETRLGIVMYGGVSLAVYENGVAQELFRAVRGEPRQPGVYDLVKAIADTDIVVDILSGTSAGGINGIFLAYALANGKDFRESAALWRDKGDIMALLRKPKGDDVASLLDSRGYYQTELEGAFHRMDEHPYGDPDASEIDLFVTGTDVHGRVFTEFDDQGHPIDVKDHRAVFVLSYRPERKNEFGPQNISGLAKLARITSCFPVAFEPVHVPEPAPNAGQADPDVLLRRWGQLTHDAYFLDGGLLDNKPFSYTIDAIFGRLAERPVDRMLLYVEPDPEHFNDEPLKETPNVVKAASDALVSIPGYESIAGDLQAIAERNSKVARYEEIRQSLEGLPEVADFLDEEAPDALAPLKSIAEPTPGIYRESRLAQLRDRALLGLLKEDGELRLLAGERRRAAQALVDSFAAWPGDDAGAGALDEFDVYFRLRRLYRMVYFIARSMWNGHLTRQDRYGDILRRLNHQIEMLEMIRFAIEEVVDDSHIPVGGLAGEAPEDRAVRKWLAVQNVLRTLLAANPFLCTAGVEDWGEVEDPRRREEEQRQRRDFMAKGLRPLVDKLRGQDGSASVSEAATLLHDTDRQEREILRLLRRGDPVRKEYCRFALLDAYLFPIEWMGGIESKDPIRTVRISPLDGRFGVGKDKGVQGKLCGRKLGHFGGFMKRSWRANDIMWGRLDAVCQLIQCIVTPERVNSLGAGVGAASFDLEKMFPNSARENIAQLARDLQLLPEYAQEHIENPPGDQELSRFEQFQERLVRAAQNEILEEEIPRVMAAAIDQHTQWNQYSISRFPPPFRPERQAWATGVRQIDQAILSVASEKLVEADRKRRPGMWTEFFDSGQYRVAAESLADGVPKPVLLEVGAQAALVFQNCLTGVLGKKAASLRSNAVFRFGVDLPLKGIYRFAVFQRTAPEFARSFSAATLLLSLAALAAGFYWRKELIFQTAGFNGGAFALLIVAPLAALFVQTAMYGLVRWLTLFLLAPVAAFLGALFMMDIGWAHWHVGPGAWAKALAWAVAQSTPIWVGVIAALAASIPFRALRREIVARLQDWRRAG